MCIRDRLSTLHANNSYHALGRILSFYSPEARPTLLSDLGAGLRAIVSQRLLRANAGGRVPAVEVLLNTKLVAEPVSYTHLDVYKRQFMTSVTKRPRMASYAARKQASLSGKIS